MFRDFVRLCRELDLYGCELVAVDGSRIKAVNNPNRNFTRVKLEKELDRAAERLDSRLVKTSKGAVVGYNVQIAVDAKHNLIAEQQVHTNVTDVGLLAQTAVAARENLAVEQIDVVADRGYYKIGDVEACEAAGVTPHVPNPVPVADDEQGALREVPVPIR